MRTFTACLVLAGALAGCTSPEEERFIGRPDPSADPPRDRTKPFASGERISSEGADLVLEYPAGTLGAESAHLAGDLDDDGVGDLLVVGSHILTSPCGERCSTGPFVDILYGGSQIAAAERPDARLILSVEALVHPSVRPAGDLDADGAADFVVGLPPSFCMPGSAFVVYGGARLGGEHGARGLASLIREPEDSCSRFGVAAALGDIDGDGFDDFAIGAPGFDGGRGRLYLFYGGRARLPAEGGAVASAVLLDPDVPYFGYAEPAGDVNGDGFDDFIALGEWQTEAPTRASLVFGRRERYAGTLYVTDIGAPIDERARSFAALGDVDRDGFDDLAITGADTERDGFVVRGRAAFEGGVDLDGASAWAMGLAQSTFVTAVAGAGDIDRDGHLDLLYADPSAGDPDAWRGRVFLFRGSADGFQGELRAEQATVFLGRTWHTDGDRRMVDRDALGGSMSGGSDVNGDGVDDLAFAAPQSPPGGRVYVWFGHAR